MTDHPAVAAATGRIQQIIDTVDPADLIRIVKESPALRGMLAGNIAELKLRQYLGSFADFTDFYRPDDCSRLENRYDLRFMFEGQPVTILLKPMQIASIKWNIKENRLQCAVQNETSAKRDICLPNGRIVNTTSYVFGDYDILAVPLFLFTGKWNFAYLLNKDCAPTTSPKYSARNRRYLIRSFERLTYPLSGSWMTDIVAAIRRLRKP